VLFLSLYSHRRLCVITRSIATSVTKSTTAAAALTHVFKILLDTFSVFPSFRLAGHRQLQLIPSSPSLSDITLSNEITRNIVPERYFIITLYYSSSDSVMNRNDNLRLSYYVYSKSQKCFNSNTSHKYTSVFINMQCFVILFT